MEKGGDMGVEGVVEKNEKLEEDDENEEAWKPEGKREEDGGVEEEQRKGRLDGGRERVLGRERGRRRE